MTYFSAHHLNFNKFFNKDIRRCAGESQRNHKGFTLVELILAMGIFTILMTVIMRVFLSVIETRLSAEAESATTQDSQFIYARLAYDIARATAVVTPASAGQSGSQLQLTIDGSTYAYQVAANGNLVINKGGSDINLTSAGTRATAATFTRRGGATGAQSITFDITLNSTTVRAGSGAVVRHVTGTVGTR